MLGHACHYSHLFEAAFARRWSSLASASRSVGAVSAALACMRPVEPIEPARGNEHGGQQHSRRETSA
jgi:hypothetical protein